MWQQSFVLAVIALAFLLFGSGRVRYDVVGLSAVVLLALAGVLPRVEIFRGFANDAVLSVIAVMVVGRALRLAGTTEPFAALLLKARGANGQTLALTGTVSLFSAFMNNTGALAVFLPVAVHMARRMRRLASATLMPLASASLLGGLVTLIGTPPNILVSSFRAEHLGRGYGFFDFTPVGAGVAFAGVLFLSFVGWRLLPPRRGSMSTERMLKMQHYFSEVMVPSTSPLVGESLRGMAEFDIDVNVVGIVRGAQRLVAPATPERIEAGDILLVEAGADQLHRLREQAGLRGSGDGPAVSEEGIRSEEVELQQIVIARGSPLVGNTARGLRMRWRFGVNLLAVSRQGERILRRLPDVRLRAGDVLLVQVRTEALQDVLDEFKCYTLVDHEHPLPSVPKMVATVSVFATAIALVVLNVLPLGLSFLTAALILVLTGTLSAREAYMAVDWPVVILLASTLCLGSALEYTGGAKTLALALVRVSEGWPAPLVVATVFLGTMLISNFVNNAATAVLMAPIAYSLAVDLDVSPDTLLMAVALGASSCFLTPIGHQCNTLVLGPGGYRFGDYFRMGIWLSLVVFVVGLSLIFWVWPLGGGVG